MGNGYVALVRNKRFEHGLSTRNLGTVLLANSATEMVRGCAYCGGPQRPFGDTICAKPSLKAQGKQ